MITPSFPSLIRSDFKLPPPKPPSFCGKLLIPLAKLLGMSLTRDTSYRLPAFIAATVLIMTAIVLTAHFAWQRIGEIQRRFTSVQLESSRIADHFQLSILDLNNSLLRYQLIPESSEWDYFIRRSEGLNKWIDEQFQRFGDRMTEPEKKLLHQLDDAFDVYMVRALNLEVKPEAAAASSQQTAEALVRFAAVKKETDKLLNLGIQLANSHRESLNSFFIGSNSSLQILRWILLG